MSNKSRPLSELTKKEFDEAYKEMIISYEGKWDKYPLPTKEEIINQALQSGQITLIKAMEFNGRQ